MHGERARRLRNNSTRDYWKRRHGNHGCPPYPTTGHHDPQSVKRMTNRAERRASRQSLHNDQEEVAE